MALRKVNLMDLPDEILSSILRFVSGVDLARLSQVCRRFNYITDQSKLWKQACLSQPGLRIEKLIMDKRNGNFGPKFWRRCFQQFYCRSETKTCPGCLRECTQMSMDATTLPMCAFVCNVKSNR